MVGGSNRYTCRIGWKSQNNGRWEITIYMFVLEKGAGGESVNLGWKSPLVSVVRWNGHFSIKDLSILGMEITIGVSGGIEIEI